MLLPEVAPGRNIKWAVKDSSAWRSADVGLLRDEDRTVAAAVLALGPPKVRAASIVGILRV